WTHAGDLASRPAARTGRSRATDYEECAGTISGLDAYSPVRQAMDHSTVSVLTFILLLAMSLLMLWGLAKVITGLNETVKGLNAIFEALESIRRRQSEKG